MALIYLNFDETLLHYLNMTPFSKKNLKKFDCRPCSNIGTADKLSEHVIPSRVEKIYLQPLAVNKNKFNAHVLRARSTRWMRQHY